MPNIQQLKQVIYNLERQYGSKMFVGKYHVGEIDYENPLVSTSVEEHPCKGIPLPESTLRSIVKRLDTTIETYEAMFLFKWQSVPFILDTNCYIITKDGKYDVLESKHLENVYFLVGTKRVNRSHNER